MRITIPGDVVTSNGQDVSGLGNTQIVSIFGFKADWGGWGIGPAFVLPSATTQRLQPQWQLGLAALTVYTGAKNGLLGALVQNLTSTFGSGEVSSNMLYIQPIVTYTLPHGWYVGLPDYDLSFNLAPAWRGDHSARAASGEGDQVLGALRAERGRGVRRPDCQTVGTWTPGTEFSGSR